MTKLSEKLATVTYWETGNQAAPIEERSYGFDREPRQWADEARALEERVAWYETHQRGSVATIDAANARAEGFRQRAEGMTTSYEQAIARAEVAEAKLSRVRAMVAEEKEQGK